MKRILELYHGSDKIVEFPELRKGKISNDYGQGFYCTAQYELACEWASKLEGKDGFVNAYDIDISELKILDLTSRQYNVLNWLTILLQNRTFVSTSPISAQAKEYLVDNFNVDVSGYDIIKGYRADDSYFSFAEDFINNTISVQHLAKAMKLGKLGIQYVLVSERAFEHLEFVKADVVSNQKYHGIKSYVFIIPCHMPVMPGLIAILAR
jgi:hypothetical protein